METEDVDIQFLDADGRVLARGWLKDRESTEFVDRPRPQLIVVSKSFKVVAPVEASGRIAEVVMKSGGEVQMRCNERFDGWEWDVEAGGSISIPFTMPAMLWNAITKDGKSSCSISGGGVVSISGATLDGEPIDIEPEPTWRQKPGLL